MLRVFELIAANADVARVTQQLGLANVSYFSHIFTKAGRLLARSVDFLSFSISPSY
jgi:hypothetical protein